MAQEGFVFAIHQDRPDLLARYVPPGGVNARSPETCEMLDRPADAPLISIVIRTGAMRCLQWLVAQGAHVNHFVTDEGYHCFPLLDVLNIPTRSTTDMLIALLKAGAVPCYSALACQECARRLHSLLALATFHVQPRGLCELLYHGARLLPHETYTRETDIRKSHDTVCERVRRCRQVCIVLLKTAPFQQKCLRRDWVRRYVWAMRCRPEWTPDLDMPYERMPDTD